MTFNYTTIYTPAQSLEAYRTDYNRGKFLNSLPIDEESDVEKHHARNTTK